MIAARNQPGSPLIGIIGCEGKWGKELGAFFKKKGCKVIGSDIGTRLANRQIVERTDVVIFSILPVSEAMRVMEAMGKFSRPEQLWLDVTSVKTEPCKAMLKSKADVAGLHPMFPPLKGNWERQSLIICPVRLSGRWQEWLDGAFSGQGLRVFREKPELHDSITAITQGIAHDLCVIGAIVMRKSGFDLATLIAHGGPVFKLLTGVIARVLGQNPEMYAGIQLHNEFVKSHLFWLSEEMKKAYEAVESGDKAELLRIFREAGRFFEDNLAASAALFEELRQMEMNRLNPHMLVLETEGGYGDQAGLLYDIAAVFKEHKVNLVSYVTKKIGEKQYRFEIATEKPLEFREVGESIRALEKLKGVKLLFHKTIA